MFVVVVYYWLKYLWLWCTVGSSVRGYGIVGLSILWLWYIELMVCLLVFCLAGWLGRKKTGFGMKWSASGMVKVFRWSGELILIIWNVFEGSLGFHLVQV